MNKPGILHDGLSAQCVGYRKVIIFRIGRIDSLAADFTISLRAVENALLLRVVEQSLRVESNTDILDDFRPPLFVIFSDRGSRYGLSGCGIAFSIRQNMRGKFLRERFVKFKEGVTGKVLDSKKAAITSNLRNFILVRFCPAAVFVKANRKTSLVIFRTS